MSDLVRKIQGSAEVKGIVDAQDGRGTRMTVRLSRTSTDRDGEVIRATGWQVPTGTVNVLVDHNNSVKDVVGKLVKTWVEGEDYMGEIEYADNVASNTLAKFVVDMHKGGHLGPVSVGFMPNKWIDPDGKTYTRQNPGPYWGSLPGREYVEQELLELSEVAVGSHRDAMVLVARAFGLSKDIAPKPEAKPDAVALRTVTVDGITFDPEAVAYSDGDPESKSPVSWFSKFLPPPADADPSRARMTDAIAQLEAAMTAAKAVLESAKRADEKEAA